MTWSTHVGNNWTMNSLWNFNLFQFFSYFQTSFYILPFFFTLTEKLLDTVGLNCCICFRKGLGEKLQSPIIFQVTHLKEKNHNHALHALHTMALVYFIFTEIYFLKNRKNALIKKTWFYFFWEFTDQWRIEHVLKPLPMQTLNIIGKQRPRDIILMASFTL